MSNGFRIVQVTKAGPRAAARHAAAVAAEEPMEIRLHGRPFAVIMRTPGADRELAAGFLFAERVVRHADDLGSIDECRDSEHPECRNVLDVRLAGAGRHALDSMLASRRNVVTNASCGLCGRVTIDSLRVDAPPVTASWTLEAPLVRRLPDRLREAQPLFAETGGLHGAALFARDGRLEAASEDVGRHNAVDKVIGRMLLARRLPLGEQILFVSGRCSFEIVQKAFLAGIPVVGAVSAPSSLSVELAQEAGITLLGFVRNGSFNVYAHAQRITFA